jgi:hypothetical protein
VKPPRRDLSDDRDVHLAEIQERVGAGEYRVDPSAVADAIVRRLAERLTSAPPSVRAQNECS